MNLGRNAASRLTAGVLLACAVALLICASANAADAPKVTDDGVCSADTTRLHATWTTSEDTASYQYAIGNTPTDPCGGYVVPWTSTPAAGVTKGGLSLTDGRTYYFYVKSIDKSGNASAVGVSDGITVNKAYAQPGKGLVDKDLLAGWGNFDYGAGYMEEWQFPKWTQAFRVPVSDQNVAVGWGRYLTITGPSYPYKDPWELWRSRVGPMPGHDSSCQFVDIGDVRSDSYWARGGIISARIPVNDAKPYMAHTGDVVEFEVGYFRPIHTDLNVTYGVEMRWYYASGAPTTSFAYKLPDQAKGTYLIPKNVTGMSIAIFMDFKGGTPDGARPGFFVDDVHLYLKRGAGRDRVTELVPVPRNRTISTMRTTVIDRDDIHSIAENYDVVDVVDVSFREVPRLRYYNPDIKIYLYESGGAVADLRAKPTDKDPWWTPGALKFQDVRDNHSDWLYALGAGKPFWPSYTVQQDPRQGMLADWQYEPYAVLDWPSYPTHYAYRKTVKEFQDAWIGSASEQALRFRADGIIVDDMSLWTFGHKGSGDRLPGTKDGPEVSVQPWEIQQFMHAVVPQLHSKGLKVIQNACTVNIKDGYIGDERFSFLSRFPEQGRIYFDAHWHPYDYAGQLSSPDYKSKSPQYSTGSPARYLPNSAETTPDALFQEWAFFRHWSSGGAVRNQYGFDYWSDCLADMEWVAGTGNTWYMQAYGVDRSDDPADGLDGWVHFGLCSYLLACSPLTSFAVSGATRPTAPDLSFTVALGDPVSKAGTPGCRTQLPVIGLASQPADRPQMRRFSSGIVIVNPSPTKSYTIKLPAALTEEATAHRHNSGDPFTILPHTGRVFYYVEQ